VVYWGASGGFRSKNEALAGLSVIVSAATDSNFQHAIG